MHSFFWLYLQLMRLTSHWSRQIATHIICVFLLENGCWVRVSMCLQVSLCGVSSRNTDRDWIFRASHSNTTFSKNHWLSYTASEQRPVHTQLRSLFSWFPLFSKYPCAKFSACSFLFSPCFAFLLQFHIAFPQFLSHFLLFVKMSSHTLDYGELQLIALSLHQLLHHSNCNKVTLTLAWVQCMSVENYWYIQGVSERIV